MAFGPEQSSSKHEVCQLLAARRFTLKIDPKFGAKSVEDLTPVFNIDQTFWWQYGSQSPWSEAERELGSTQAESSLKTDDKLAFFHTGVKLFADIMALLDDNKMTSLVPAPPYRNSMQALDFGCGLGRTSNALVNAGFEKVLCVDSSQPMLDTAQKELANLAGNGNIQTNVMHSIEMVQSGLDLICKVPPNSVDFVHSVDTLQYMRPMIQAVYIEQLCDVLKPGSGGVLHIPMSEPEPARRATGALEKTGEYGLPRSEVVRHLALRGCFLKMAARWDAGNSLGSAGQSTLFAIQKGSSANARVRLATGAESDKIDPVEGAPTLAPQTTNGDTQPVQSTQPPPLSSSMDGLTGGSALEDASGTDGAKRQRRVCDVMQGRQFTLDDQQCPKALTKSIGELRAWYDAEQPYWAKQGSSNPWAAALDNVMLGTDIPLEQKLQFYHSGGAWINEMLQRLDESSIKGFLPKDISHASALDFGCGLGRMSNSIAKLGFKQTLCVDSAQSMLDAAKVALRELAGRGTVMRDALKRIGFVISGPDLLCSVSPGSMDFVHSVLTLQYMKPLVQASYIEQFCDALRVGGTGLVQTAVELRTDTGDRHCALEGGRDGSAMYHLPEREITNHLTARGCVVQMVTPYDTIEKEAKTMLFAFRKSANIFD